MSSDTRTCDGQMSARFDPQVRTTSAPWNQTSAVVSTFISGLWSVLTRLTDGCLPSTQWRWLSPEQHTNSEEAHEASGGTGGSHRTRRRGVHWRIVCRASVHLHRLFLVASEAAHEMFFLTSQRATHRCNCWASRCETRWPITNGGNTRSQFIPHYHSTAHHLHYHHHRPHIHSSPALPWLSWRQMVVYNTKVKKGGWREAERRCERVEHQQEETRGGGGTRTQETGNQATVNEEEKEKNGSEL